MNSAASPTSRWSNDFARGVGLPLGHREAARLIRTGQPRPVDLIVDDTDGVVVNAVHVGAGAEATMISRPWKRRLRTAAFPLGAIAAGFLVDGWRPRVEVDGKARHERPAQGTDGRC